MPENGTSTEAILDALEGALVQDMETHPLHVLEKSGRPSSPERDALDGYSMETRHDLTDWISALCSDLAPDATSQIQTARRDYFFGNLKNIVANTTRVHLRRTLFASWDYADGLDNQSLHIGPSEDRRYAYQWHRPSGDPTRKKHGGMLGANRLAIEAFPMLQSFAFGIKLSTVGFTGRHADNTRWTWPIWQCRLGYWETVSLLSLAELQDEVPGATDLRARGIATAFRCRRILVGKTPNFTPATAVF